MLNPYVRYMDERKCYISYPQKILAYDYRLFAVLGGCCRAEAGSQILSLSSCDILIIPPAVPYRLLFEGSSSAHLYVVNFSLNYLPGKPLPPENAEAFQPSRMPEAPNETLFASVLKFTDQAKCCQSLTELYREYERSGHHCAALCSSMLKTVLLRLIQQNDTKAPHSDSLTHEIAAFLDAHCREKLSAEEIGRHFGYHPYHLNRLFRSATGCTMHRYQMDCRIRRAQSMLKNTALSVGEIAESLGFAPGPYFSEVFRSAVGMTPSDYRKTNQ